MQMSHWFEWRYVTAPVWVDVSSEAVALAGVAPSPPLLLCVVGHAQFLGVKEAVAIRVVSRDRQSSLALHLEVTDQLFVRLLSNVPVEHRLPLIQYGL